MGNSLSFNVTWFWLEVSCRCYKRQRGRTHTTSASCQFIFFSEWSDCSYRHVWVVNICWEILFLPSQQHCILEASEETWGLEVGVKRLMNKHSKTHTVEQGCACLRSNQLKEEFHSVMFQSLNVVQFHLFYWCRNRAIQGRNQNLWKLTFYQQEKQIQAFFHCVLHDRKLLCSCIADKQHRLFPTPFSAL